MPTYWICSELSHPADSTVHAGKTRIALQNNLRCVAENSGYNYDITVRDMPLSESINNTWDWLAEIEPLPIPVWRNHGNSAWREYTFDILAESATANDIKLRVFLLKNRSHPAIDAATGDVAVSGGTTWSYKELTIAAALTRYEATITFDISDSVSASHVSLDQVWVHLAAYEPTAPGGDNLIIHAMNVKESA